MEVANMGFLLDRLGADCAPLQFLRELTVNAIEAIQALTAPNGEIIGDFDHNHYDLEGVFKLDRPRAGDRAADVRSGR